MSKDHNKLRSAIFRIRIPEDDGVQWGTGFFVSPSGLALTAYHNLPTSIEHQGRGIVEAYYRDQKISLEWRADSSDRNMDVAVLQLREPPRLPIDHLRPAYLPGVPSQERGRFWAGRRVSVSGFPTDGSAEQERRIVGHIDSTNPLVSTIELDDQESLSVERLRILGPGAKPLSGTSGGPVFDPELGLVIGIDLSRLRPERETASILASELTFLRNWPKSLRDLVRPKNLSTTKGELTEEPFEEGAAEQVSSPTMARSEGRVVAGHSDLSAIMDASFAPITAFHAVTFLVLALSMLSFGIGLFHFGGSHLGAGLTFGGAILAYEAVYVFLRRERQE